MKKLFALLLVAVLCFSLVACGGGNDTPSVDNNEPQTNVSSSIDISKLDGAWMGTEEGVNLEYYYVFDGNGNMTKYVKNLSNDSIDFDSTYKCGTSKSGALLYWSTKEEGVYCPVEIIEENGNVQYKISEMLCNEVEDFSPNITE